MVKGGRSLEQVELQETVMPLCVINKEDAVAHNADYVLTDRGILQWEQTYGKIPAGCVYDFSSGWGKRPGEIMDQSG